MPDPRRGTGLRACRPTVAAIVLAAALAGQLATAPPASAAGEPKPIAAGEDRAMQLRVRASWGHCSGAGTAFHVRLSAEKAKIAEAKGVGLEGDEGLRDGAWQTRSGGGDVDGVEFTLVCDRTPPKRPAKLHSIWAALLAQSDADTVRRLRPDPACRIDPRKLSVQMDRAGTRGFSVTADQLARHEALWVPSLDLYLTAGEEPVTFEDHQQALSRRKGRRVLDQVAEEGEATYEQWTRRWADMGSPAYANPFQVGPGHVVGLTWDSAVHKFGIDRGAGVWNDYGKADRFRFWFDFADLARGIRRAWKGQTLDDGLPILTTTLEKDGLRYEVEQFACPLDGPPKQRRGDVAMVLLQNIRITNLTQRPRTVSIGMNHRRYLAGARPARVEPQRRGGAFVFCETAGQRALFAVQGPDLAVASCETLAPSPRKGKEGEPLACKVVVSLSLPAAGTKELVVKLPSPTVPREKQDALVRRSYPAARKATRKFWSDCLARGAQFRVPEKAVNDLFRASLWHALRLPRRHGGPERGVRIDLPYSNFAYDQNGTPWPVNQAVYVDYMIYGLRGYNDVATEELLTIYRNNQQPDGRVAGYANWGVYTPGMIYTAARNSLLSQDRTSFGKLLPQTLKALDFCLRELRRASKGAGAARGLVRAPLNDLTGDGVWAFNQAYLYAGISTLAQSLERIGHPRAGECRKAAQSLRRDIARAFAAAAVRSPLVQLRDHTWTPYVPCEINTPRRQLDVWYPTDVDTGAVHLLRLGALPADGHLADALLNDHEDNLYLKGWGLANEPVYNQQATAYLLRDDVKAAIRAFYSYMACAFSHSALEPVEHRWAWGQYFGPPSTDGAWFDLYRHMLIRELDGGGLLLLQATPRKWLEDGQRIEIERAPTHYGALSLTVTSQVAKGRIAANIRVPQTHRPEVLYVRLRHPDAKPMKSVTVNGQDWAQFDVRKEWVVIRRPAAGRCSVVARY